jgi:hypothetical protein
MYINLSIIYFQKILVCPKQLLCRVRPNFHYLLFWISLHTTFANYQVKWSGVRTQHMTTPFVDEMYDLLKNTLTEYEVIICGWPEYIFVLENVCQKLWILLQILQLLYLYQLFFLSRILLFSLATWPTARWPTKILPLFSSASEHIFVGRAGRRK